MLAEPEFTEAPTIGNPGNLETFKYRTFFNQPNATPTYRDALGELVERIRRDRLNVPANVNCMIDNYAAISSKFIVIIPFPSGDIGIDWK